MTARPIRSPLLHRRPNRFTAYLFSCVAAGMVGCATVPHVGPTNSAGRGTQIEVSGSRGTLSERDTKAILARLAATAPDAGALERHLAIEQAVAESTLY